MNLFYLSEIVTDTVVFDKENSMHCCKVLRLKSNDVIMITNGKGFFYEGKIVDANPKATVIQITGKKQVEKNWKQQIVLCIAPTKNIARTEWAIEKCTEIGVDEITPFISFHSERKVIKHERLEKIITAAVKQSLKAWHPELNPITTFKELVKEPFDGQKFIAYIHEDHKKLLSNSIKTNENIKILIGPEGDFSPEEVELAMANGFKPISLGKERLRTETAMVSACQTVHVINQLE